ncbi:MAG: hypothetical protein MZW92_69735 [Comamonadaceae bacterium]|nr:hypothetical protein [Comamonadaceae bacterium]
MPRSLSALGAARARCRRPAPRPPHRPPASRSRSATWWPRPPSSRCSMVGGALFLDTLALGETGVLRQSITFSVAPDVAGLTGFASWFVNEALAAGRRRHPHHARRWRHGARRRRLPGSCSPAPRCRPCRASHFGGGGTFTMDVSGKRDARCVARRRHRLRAGSRAGGLPG